MARRAVIEGLLRGGSRTPWNKDKGALARAHHTRRGYYVCSFEAVKLEGEAAIEHVVIALGSNLGERERHLEAARDALVLRGLSPLRASSLHTTAPVGGPPGQGPFLNQVVVAPLCKATPPPRRLLEACLEIEASRGRVRRERWGPRTLDLDLLLYGSQVVDEEGLRIPHPRLAERRFVLAPLCEIIPEVMHPVFGRSFRDLLASLDES